MIAFSCVHLLLWPPVLERFRTRSGLLMMESDCAAARVAHVAVCLLLIAPYIGVLRPLGYLWGVSPVYSVFVRVSMNGGGGSARYRMNHLLTAQMLAACCASALHAVEMVSRFLPYWPALSRPDRCDDLRQTVLTARFWKL